MLTINNNQYNTRYNNNIKSASKITFGQGFKLLSFLKHDTVEISNKNIPALSEKKILELINASVNDKNFIGQGSQAKVYRIKNSDFVVKIPYDTMFFRDENFYKTYVNDMDRVNHVEAKFENGITIMKLIKGDSLEYCRNYQKVAKLPVSAYNNLLKQICKAQKLDMYFDNVPANIIADYNSNTLTAIDFLHGYSDIAGELPFRPITQIFDALTYKNDKYKLQTSGKILLAGLEELHPEVTPCLKIEDLDFEDILKFAEKRYKNQSESIPAQLPKLENLLLEIKCLKIKESHDQSIKNLLQSKINEAEKLISKYFELDKLI